MKVDIRDMEAEITQDLAQGAGIMVNVAFTSYHRDSGLVMARPARVARRTVRRWQPTSTNGGKRK